MHRRTSARGGVALAFAAVAAVGVLLLLSGASSAGADEVQPTVVSVSSHELLAGQDTAVVTISVEPGTQVPAAISASLAYDASQAGFVGCAPTPGAMCNNVDNTVRFAYIDVGGLSGATDLATVELSTSSVEGVTALTLTVEELYDVAAVEIAQVRVIDGTITAAPAGVLTGVVRDEAGERGVPALDVCIDPITSIEAGTPDGAQARCTTTDVFGRYALDALASSSYALTVADREARYDTVTLDVTITSPEVTELDIVVSTDGVDRATSGGPDDGGQGPPAATAVGVIAGTVHSADTGLAVFGARVCIERPMIGDRQCALTRTDGTFSFAELPTGNYRIGATDPSGRFGDVAEKIVGLVSPGSRDIDLDLPAR